MADPAANGTSVPDVKALSAQVYSFGEERLRTLASMLVERVQFAQLHGLTFDNKRDLYKTLGYARVLTNKDYGERYTRGGLAGRLVDVFPNATWRGEVEVVEDENPHEDTLFEKAYKDLDRQHQVKSKLLRVDKLSLLSTYAVLLIGAPGSRGLDEELPKGTPGKILYLTPFSGGGGPGRGNVGRDKNIGTRTTAYDADVSIYEIEDDDQDARFGLPRYYELRRADITKDSGLRKVHWSRIIHIAESILWDEVYGLPALERVWNLLDDLEKVTGGGAEAFWLRANAGMHLNVDKDVSLGGDKERKAALADLKQQAEEYSHQLTRWLRTRGVDVTQLGSDVANFSSPADAIITQIAGSKGIPKRILTGSEMGELASSQDRDNWKDQVHGRQSQYAGPYILRPLIDRLIKYGYLPSPAKGPDAYMVKWPSVQVLTEEEKTAGAKLWADTNSAMGEIVFTNDEIREHWYGFEPLKDDEKVPPQHNQPDPVDGNGQLPPGEQQPPNAEQEGVEEVDRELLAVLAEAIESNNTEVLDAILGTSHPTRSAE